MKILKDVFVLLGGIVNWIALAALMIIVLIIAAALTILIGFIYLVLKALWLI